jgi:hypothetical protein
MIGKIDVSGGERRRCWSNWVGYLPRDDGMLCYIGYLR